MYVYLRAGTGNPISFDVELATPVLLVFDVDDHTILYSTILYSTMLYYAVLCQHILYIIYTYMLLYVYVFDNMAGEPPFLFEVELATHHFCQALMWITMLHFTILYYTIVYTIQYYTILYHTIHYYAMLYQNVLHFIYISAMCVCI